MPIFSHLDGPLYRDHLGRDVLADYEGTGFLLPTKSGTQDIEAPGLSRGVFNEYCLVHSINKNPTYFIKIGEFVGKIVKRKRIEGNVICGSGVLMGVESNCDATIWIDGKRTNSGRCRSANELRMPFNSKVHVKNATALIIANYSNHVWQQTDNINVCEKSSRNEHKLIVQNESEIYQLESEFDEIAFSGSHRSHLNRMSFGANIITENSGVVIRKTYDRFHGRQRARVLVGCEIAGWWYLPRENREKRWTDADFRIAPELTQGKSQLRIEIDPSAGSPLWNVSSYQVFSIPKSE